MHPRPVRVLWQIRSIRRSPLRSPDVERWSELAQKPGARWGLGLPLGAANRERVKSALGAEAGGREDAV